MVEGTEVTIRLISKDQKGPPSKYEVARGLMEAAFAQLFPDIDEGDSLPEETVNEAIEGIVACRRAEVAGNLEEEYGAEGMSHFPSPSLFFAASDITAMIGVIALTRHFAQLVADHRANCDCGTGSIPCPHKDEGIGFCPAKPEIAAIMAEEGEFFRQLVPDDGMVDRAERRVKKGGLELGEDVVRFFKSEYAEEDE